MIDFLKTILSQKKEEVDHMPLEAVAPKRQTYQLYDYIKSNPQNIQVIAEVKKASPSLGDINLDVDIIKQSKTYEQSGASMISVLTDPVFFKGNIDYLREISQAVSIPTLCKDFIIDEKQIIRARNAGATVILLIVAALSDQELKRLYDYAQSLDLEVLVETHNEEELHRAHALGAKIIGVNNRDLTTFKTDIATSIELSQYFKDEPVYISESALESSSDVEKIAPYFDGILVGTALMQADNVSKKMEDLKVDKG